MGTLGYCRLDHNNSSDAHSSPPFQTSFSNVLAFTNIYIYNIYIYIYACIYIICIGVYKSSGQIIALHYTRTEQKQEIRKKKETPAAIYIIIPRTKASSDCFPRPSQGLTLVIYTRPPQQPPVEETPACR